MAGTMLISLDFELFWGLLEERTLESYQENVLGGRAAIPRLLKLFERYDIHATWATVGFMFAESYGELKNYFPVEKPTYEKPGLSPYEYFAGIGDSEDTAPCFYAPGLIRLVSETPGQEIGSHTFSHFYCREPGQTVEQFAADMAAAKKIAADHGYDVTSVILPRNQCEPEYTRVFRELGFTAYRDEEDDWIHDKIKWFPLLRLFRLLDVYLPLTGQGVHKPRKEDGVWNFTGSGMFKPIRPALKFLEGIKMHRIKARMRCAAKNDLVFHLWWHPHNIGVMTEDYLAQLEEIFRYYHVLKEKYGMESLNMGELACRLEEEEHG
ncbi:MAG: polysaccharide deacetylase family protein [Oscillospiraceae bacterium]|nr:polysaccharide deacetylase family protein [Oscillospiraceae bacterium]MBQ7130167.1 polysaccharide deacetylase family protein [Oscillospiraceae bacterium]